MSEDSNETLVLAEFSQGYILRNCIEYLKSHLEDFNINFTKDRMFIHKTDPLNLCYIEVDFDVQNLGVYEYLTKEEIITFGIDCIPIRGVTNNIGKKDGFKTWIERNSETDQLVLFTELQNSNNYLKSNDDNGVIKFVRKHVDGGIGTERVHVYSEKPNCFASIDDLTKMCKIFGTLLYNEIEIIGFPKGVIFKGASATELSDGIYPFGDCYSGFNDKCTVSKNNKIKYDPEKEIVRITINLNKIKNLTKKNFGTNSILHFFFVQNQPIKIMAKGGSYATIKTYLSCQN